jgi:hypothetical protein
MQRILSITPAFVIALALLSGTASARNYSTDIDVLDEQELRQLYYDGLLDDEEFDVLLGLFEAPIDINTSGRQDLYQLPGVTDAIASAIVDERVANGVYAFLDDVSTRVEEVDKDLIELIKPFVRLRLPKGSSPPVRGSFDFGLYKQFEATRAIEDDHSGKGHTARQLGYGQWPAMMFAGGVDLFGWLDAGLSGTLQEGMANIAYEPASQDFFGTWGQPVFRPHSGWIRVQRPKGEVLLGTYHVHFGHGLVLSTVSGRDRHGIFVRRTGIGGDDRIREHSGLIGVTARAPAVKIGRATLDMTAVGSIRDYDQYVGYIGLAGGEDLDPADPETLAPGPRIWVDGQKTSYMTMPRVFRVGLAGGNVALRFNRRTAIGITGYGAFLDKAIIEGVEDQNTLMLRQRWPNDPGFGSLGVHGSFGVWLFDLSAEYGLFLTQGVAANAFYFVAEMEPAWGEFVVSLRHYDEGYGNPFNRGEANSDQLAGNRARNEQGLRFAATIEPDKRFQVRARVDLSRNIRYDIHDLNVRGRVRGTPIKWLQLGLNVNWTNQNLDVNGRQHTYGSTLRGALSDVSNAGEGVTELELDLDEEGLERLLDDLLNGTTHAGEKFSWSGQVRLQSKKWGNVNVRYKQDFTDNGKTFLSGGECVDNFQRGHSVRVVGRLKPTKTTTIAAGALWFDEDWDGDRSNGAENGPTAAHGYIQVEQKIKNKVKFKLRGKLGRRLTDPPSACDEGNDQPSYDYEYEPDDYDQRFFGELLFRMSMKF